MRDVQIKTADVSVPDGGTMTIHYASPEGAMKAGILVLQEAFGVNGHIRDIVKRFSRLGYFAAAPELFHRTAQHFETGYTDFSLVVPHMKALTVAGIQADLRATHSWLLSQTKLEAQKIAAIGFCMGGRAAYLGNAILPLAASVSFYGGGIAPDLLPMAAQQHGPMLLIWGGKDQHNPISKVRTVADALASAGKTFRHVEFSDGDHGFFCDERPQYNAQAAGEAWAITQSFLNHRLGLV